MTDSQFLTIISVIAARHNCAITNVDFEQHIINLDGPDDEQTACANEIAEVLSAYTI